MPKTFRILRTVLVVLVIQFGLGCGFQTKLIFPAKKLDPSFPLQTSDKIHEIVIPTTDSIALSALQINTFHSEKIILYFHGNAGALDSWQFIADDLNYLKTDLILFDYRGYGKSQGTITEAGLYKDAQAVFAYAKKLGYADSNIIIYGRSIGTGIAVDLAQHKNIDALILESPYSSLKAMIYREFWFMMPFLYLSYDFNSCAKAARIQSKVLILHGTDDEVIPFKYGQQLHSCFKSKNSRFIPIVGGHHNDLDAFPQKPQELKAILNIK